MGTDTVKQDDMYNGHEHISRIAADMLKVLKTDEKKWGVILRLQDRGALTSIKQISVALNLDHEELKHFCRQTLVRSSTFWYLNNVASDSILLVQFISIFHLSPFHSIYSS